MRKGSKRMWLVLGIVVSLAIAGGVIYASTPGYFKGKFETASTGDYAGGIGMGRTPPIYDRIKWANERTIWLGTTTNALYVQSGKSTGEGDYAYLEVLRTGSTDATAALVGANTGWDEQSVVLADSQGNAYMESVVSSAAVDVKADGDVIITLGN